ncbi:helix-turn-helix domain-containing protein [Acetobacter pasteurianus]|uniref:helix-turn-helix domain-containing protein n=1 Tax=Acetobacter pasteurianus TaxID=438 RepID=UPI003D0FF3AA
MSHTETMGDRLRAVRRAKGLVQAAAAEAIGISRNHLTEIENGKDPGFQTFCALADFYQVSMDYLYRGVPSPNASAQTLDNAEEAAWLGLWRDMNEKQRRMALALIQAAIDTDAA